jgi:hypothetical protein
MSSHQSVSNVHNRSLRNQELPPECHRTCRSAYTLRPNTPIGQATIGPLIEKWHSNPISVRRKRQRLPSSLLIENASVRLHGFATTLLCRGVSDEG